MTAAGCHLTATSPRQARHSRLGPLAQVSVALTLAGMIAAGGAAAQTAGTAGSIPGLIVTTTPPPGPAPAPPPPQAKPAPSSKSAAGNKAHAPKPTKQASTGGDGGGSTKGSQSIVALVNDEPITGFEVERRSQFMALSSNISDQARANMKAIAENPKTNERLRGILEETLKANQGKTREAIIALFEERKKQFVLSLQKQAVESARASVLPGMKKKALDELIEERLKLQEAKKLNVTIPDDEVEKMFKGIADRNKMTSEQFAAHIKSQGADATDMKARFKASLAWRDVIRRRYGHQISVSPREVERVLAQGTAGEDTVELQLQKITLSSTGKIDQRVMAQRLEEAETLRRQFAGCKSTAGLVKDRPNAKFEDLGSRKAGTVSEPTRSLLLNAKDGEMVPASLAAGGVELYAVCGRKTVSANEEKRAAAENELQMKEFERLAQRHLLDLRKDALIEMR